MLLSPYDYLRNPKKRKLKSKSEENTTNGADPGQSTISDEIKDTANPGTFITITPNKNLEVEMKSDEGSSVQLMENKHQNKTENNSEREGEKKDLDSNSQKAVKNEDGKL